MVEFKSNKSKIYKNAEEVFNYLSKAENYEVLMPSNVRSFQASENGAKLNIQGIGDIELAFTRKEEFSLLEMKPQNQVPFEFDLQWQLSDLGAETEVEAIIHAKLNFMMRMMAEKLLVDFLNVQVHKLSEIMNND